MTAKEIDELLVRSFDDHRLSRGERQTLGEGLAMLERVEDRAALCQRAFELARGQQAPDVLDWLEAVVKLLVRDPRRPSAIDLAEAHFSPGDDCPRRIAQCFEQARRKAAVCVFTITDDRISSALLDAHHRGVAIRVITDNDKATDEGSDIVRLDQAGIPIRVDRTEYHMHHKFAIFDDLTLLTGSYNWTRGAARYNNENFIVTGDHRLITSFSRTFDRLWDTLG